MKPLLLALGLLLAAALPATAAETAAQYPSRPIRMIVPVTPGGTHDVIARGIAEKLQQAWGQPVIVEGKVGANGMLSASFVAKAPADGYTLLFSLSNLVQNLIVVKDPPYRLDDLAPVSQVANYPTAFAINADIPATTLPEFIKLVREKPRAYSFGSFGVGSGPHILGEGLNKEAGLTMTHVPYKGETSSYADLASGQLQANFGSAGFYMRQLASGRVRVLAINNARRLKTFPEIPTFGESGYPDLDLSGWGGMFLPAGTPTEIVAKLSAEIQRIVALPELQRKILDTGTEPVGSNSADFARKLQADLQRWQKLVKAIGFTVE